MSPSSVWTRTRTGFACAYSVTQTQAITTSSREANVGLITCGSHRAGAISTKAPLKSKRSPSVSSEPIGRRELELPSGEDRRSPGVLAEPRVADQVDVAGGQQVLGVEQVEHVGSDFEVVGSDGELPRHGEVGIIDELPPRGVAPSRRARLAASRIAGRAKTGAINNRVARIANHVGRTDMAVYERAETQDANEQHSFLHVDQRRLNVDERTCTTY